MNSTAVDESTLGARLKTRLALVSARAAAAEKSAREGWLEVPDKLRAALQAIARRVRSGLDVPSRREVAELADRLDDIDRKLARIEALRKSDAQTLSRLEKQRTTAPAPAKSTKARPRKASAAKQASAPKAAASKAGKAGKSKASDAKPKSGDAR